MKQNDKAILLNRISYSESSYILTFYTLHSGLQKYIFQGGKKKKTPLFPLLISEITFFKRPDSELGKLTASEATQALSSLSFDPLKSVISFFIADVLMKCLKTEEKDQELFSFLETCINDLNETEEFSIFPLFFLTELAKQLGICPHIQSKETSYFNIFDGIITDEKPIGDVYYKADITTLISDCIQYQVNPEGYSKTLRKEALQALIHYYQVHIPRFGDLVSLPVIEEVLYG